MSDDFESLKKAVARVTFVDNNKTGTAFYVGNSIALTALHVVADVDVSPPRFLGGVMLRFPGIPEPISAEPDPEFWSQDGDWAALRCATPPTAKAIEFGGDVDRDADWQAYGYPGIEADGMNPRGKVRDSMFRRLEQPRAGSMLQLFCEEAAAGRGAPLHGLSGAPCLVNGKAVGILRSTLVKDLVDGSLRRELVTVAGTVYATPCQQVVQWQIDHRRSLLPSGWAPAKIALEDFLVVLSSQETAPGEVPKGKKRLALRNVINVAFKNLQPGVLSKPHFVTAGDVMVNREALSEFVAALCRAKVVVFDVSGFEPAVMFLAGVRAVCRRGLTLLSVGGNVALGEELGVPFNIKDANIVVHSLKQNKESTTDSVTLLTDRLRRGLREIDSPQYLDLPVFDAVRVLPPDRRGIIPDEEGVLVLCSFEHGYRPFWKEKLRMALGNELKRLRDQKNLTGNAVVGVARSFELASPRLVTQAVYEAIRRMQSCVVDLTGWSPNVLFELGVRLAASGQRSVCIIERGWADKLPACDPAQVHRLASLLLSDEFLYDAELTWEEQDVFSNAYGAAPLPPPPLLTEGALHTLVERNLEVELEPAARPVHAELLAQAALFSRPAGAGGRSKPVGLFPGNTRLTDFEEEADFERLMAVWLYLTHRYDRPELLANAGLCKALDEAITALFDRHSKRLTAAMTEELNDLADAIEDRGT